LQARRVWLLSETGPELVVVDVVVGVVAGRRVTVVAGTVDVVVVQVDPKLQPERRNVSVLRSTWVPLIHSISEFISIVQWPVLLKYYDLK
jgi:hypothetical protein